MNEEIKKFLYEIDLSKDLQLNKHGEWLHQGARISKQSISDYFFRSLKYDPESNTYFLEIGKGRATVEVEDTPFFVLSFDTSTLPWILNLSGETRHPLLPESLFIGNENQIYCLINNGQDRARFSRSAHQTLLHYAVSDDQVIIGGRHYVLSKT